MHQKVQYQVIDPDTYGTQFVVDGKNVQIDLKSIKIGQIVHIALKSDVRPAARPKSGVKQYRYFAPYGRNEIVASEVCTMCAYDTDAPLQTICVNCIESWCWDWFIRCEPKWLSHGNYASYNTYGCRCPECRLAGHKYLMARRGKNMPYVSSVRNYGTYPSVTVVPE